MSKEKNVLQKAVSKWESRKMQLWLIVFIASTVMYYFGKVTFESWADLQKYALGIFVVGNGTEYVADAMKKPAAQPQAEKKEDNPEPDA